MIRLGDIADVFDGPHATPKKIETGPVYLGLDSINERGEIIPEGFNFLSEEDYIKWTKRVTPRKDDIIFSYEASLYRYCIIPDNFKCCLGRRVAVVRVKDKRINPKWLFYYFLSKEWNLFLSNNLLKGSTVNRISVDKYPDYSIPEVDLTIQNKIVSVLDKYTNLIEENKNFYSNAMEYVEKLFELVFIKKDYSSIGVKREEVTYSKKTLNDLISLERGGDWGDSAPTKKNTLKVFCIRGADFPSVCGTIEPDFQTRYISDKNDYKKLQDGDLVIEVSGNPGRIIFINKNTLKRFDNNVISSNFCVAIALKNKEYSYWLYLMWKNLYKAGLCKNYTGKTTIGNLLYNALSEQYEFDVPDSKTVEAFNKRVAAIFERMQFNLAQNDLLFEARNKLLNVIIHGKNLK